MSCPLCKQSIKKKPNGVSHHFFSRFGYRGCGKWSLEAAASLISHSSINAIEWKLVVKCLCPPRGPQELPIRIHYVRRFVDESKGLPYEMVGVLQQRGGLLVFSLVLRVWPMLMKSLHFLLPQQWNCHWSNSLVRWNSNKMVETHTVFLWSSEDLSIGQSSECQQNAEECGELNKSIFKYCFRIYELGGTVWCVRASFTLKRHSGEH